eukprot:TRINITY_DN15550_c0_g1_i2.p1 TRINITY_DN15550_c0_g1~~TRINITY_DN15550_c0_g1_i2.p1  ORF type:complete len:128 (+),score=27.83 TRINITY_DN15550_c0_g1_i2:221-604(+)
MLKMLVLGSIVTNGMLLVVVYDIKDEQPVYILGWCLSLIALGYLIDISISNQASWVKRRDRRHRYMRFQKEKEDASEEAVYTEAESGNKIAERAVSALYLPSRLASHRLHSPDGTVAADPRRHSAMT